MAIASGKRSNWYEIGVGLSLEAGLGSAWGSSFHRSSNPGPSSPKWVPVPNDLAWRPVLRLILFIKSLELVIPALSELRDVTVMVWVEIFLIIIISPRILFSDLPNWLLYERYWMLRVELYFVGQGAWLYIMCSTCVFKRFYGRSVHMTSYKISILCATQWTFVSGVFHCKAEFSYQVLAL
jgi:hypothetical protein